MSPTAQPTVGVTGYTINQTNVGFIISGTLLASFALIVLLLCRQEITIFSLIWVLLAFFDFGTDVLFIDECFAIRRNLVIKGQTQTEVYRVTTNVAIGSMVVVIFVGMGNAVINYCYGRHRFVLFERELEQSATHFAGDWSDWCQLPIICLMLLANFILLVASFTNYELTYELYCHKIRDYRQYVLTSLGLLLEDVPQLIILLYWLSKCYELGQQVSTLGLVSIGFSILRFGVSFGIKTHSLWVYIVRQYRQLGHNLERLQLFIKCFCLVAEIVEIPLQGLDGLPAVQAHHHPYETAQM